jgi:hypothetical protein
MPDSGNRKILRGPAAEDPLELGGELLSPEGCNAASLQLRVLHLPLVSRRSGCVTTEVGLDLRSRACSFLGPSLAGGQLTRSKLLVTAPELTIEGRGCNWGVSCKGRVSDEGRHACLEREFSRPGSTFRWPCDG